MNKDGARAFETVERGGYKMSDPREHDQRSNRALLTAEMARVHRSIDNYDLHQTQHLPSKHRIQQALLTRIRV